MKILSFAIAVLALAAVTCAQETIEFNSLDGLKITADFYGDREDKQRPLICLFHQAQWSRGEYREIAPKLVEMGFNCLAADARSGKEVNQVVNETAKRSTEQGNEVGFQFIQAYPDIVATLKYADQHLAAGPLIAWGSSYSAALVLKASADNPGLVDGTLSFAPNANAPWTKAWILRDAKKLDHPVFMTAAKAEHRNWKPIFAAVPESLRSSYLPATKGNHGSRALWAEFDDQQGYWDAVTQFLEANFLVPASN